jgi:hypothetical protein
MSGLALLQVSQDLDHHDKKNEHSHRQHPGTKKKQEITSQKKKHQATVDSRHVPAGFLSIRSEPHDDAAVSGALEKGSAFKVNSAHEATDGRVWLSLSDGRGWVPRDQVSEIEQEHKVRQAQQEQQDRKVRKDHKDHKDHRVPKDLEGHKSQVAAIQQNPIPKAATSELEQDHGKHENHHDRRHHKIHKSHNGRVAEIQHAAHEDPKSSKDHSGPPMEVQQFAEIQQEPGTTSKDHKHLKHHTDHKDHKGHRTHGDYGHHGGHTRLSEIQQEPASKSPRRSQEEIREEYKKIPMKEKGLPDPLEHEHGKTINADWRNEYPYKHDPKPPSKLWHSVSAQHYLSFAVGLSILAGLFA